MSVTHITSCADVAGRVDYLIVGRGTKKHEHLRAGTDRMAAMTCDSGDIRTFVREARSLARRHSRRIEAMTLIHSFPLTEFKPENPDDVQLANDLGWELAHRRYPHSRCLVITHTDGDGHDGCGAKVHNHIVVLNHDEATGRAITSQGKRHYDVAQVNDELMLEAGLSVVVPATKTRDTLEDHWAARRLADGVKSFDVELGDRIDAALADPAATDWATYVTVLRSAGVQVRAEDRDVSRDPAVVRMVTGVTYVMLDTTGPQQRTRRRMASKLSPDFMYRAVVDQLATKARELVQPAPVVATTPSNRDQLQAALRGITADMTARVEAGHAKARSDQAERRRETAQKHQETREDRRPEASPPEVVAQAAPPVVEAPRAPAQSVMSPDDFEADLDDLFGFVTDDERARWAIEDAAAQQATEDHVEGQPEPKDGAEAAAAPAAQPRPVLTKRQLRMYAEHPGLDPENMNEPTTKRPGSQREQGPSFG